MGALDVVRFPLTRLLWPSGRLQLGGDQLFWPAVAIFEYFKFPAFLSFPSPRALTGVLLYAALLVRKGFDPNLYNVNS